MSAISPSSQPTKPWNVLFITSDEHNAKMLGCAGHPTVKTPNLDRLAAQGVRFTRAYCAQPICAPTRQTMITGLYSLEHGQYGNSYVFDKRNTTWAHHFQACGYTTACVGKMHTNNEDFDYGYDYRFSKGMIPAETLKSLFFDSSARLPMIARMPGVITRPADGSPPGTVNDTLINHVDLFPTIAGLVGTADRLPERITGLDLSKCITEGAEGPRFTIAFDNVHRDGSGCSQMMARSPRYKLIRYEADDPSQRYVLYDMEADPAETRNLAYEPGYTEVVRDHEAAMDAFFAKLRKPLYPVRLAKDDPDSDAAAAAPALAGA